MSYDTDLLDQYAEPLPPPPLMARQRNNSTPSLRRDMSLDPALDMSNLRISADPISYAQEDPVQRTGTAMSSRSARPNGMYGPRHAATLPAPGLEHTYDTTSMYSNSTSSSRGGPAYHPPRELGHEDHRHSPQTAYEHVPYPHGDPGYAAQFQPHSGHGYNTQPLWHAEGYSQQAYYDNDTSGYNNQYYNVASDVLGMPGDPHYVASGHMDNQGLYSQQPPDIYSLQPGYYENGMRPPINRSATSASISPLNSRKSKAVDVSSPPFTKEYVDQYRARIKGDPDPEAHFLYAKYLIEAAKKIGSDTTDQRAVRKYRDLLIAESLKVIRRLATQGEAYAEAQFFYANCHGTGMLGLQVDHEKAYHLYLQAAKQNHPAASYRVAVCNEIGAGTKRDHARAFAFYRKAAALGDVAAMYKLGMVLLTGQLGQARDPREAISWLKRAAEEADEDNPHALHELGLLHEMPDSNVVISDQAYAKDLFTKAAQLGYTPSQFKLGQCYEYGSLTCPVDPRRSIAWYTKAAEKGDPEAELALSGWYLTGSEGVLKQSDSEAYLWARRAANKGLSKAEYAVGYYAEVGIGVKKDMELAKKWYMRAAAQGNKRAMNRLTELKRMGNKGGNVARPTRQDAKDECVIM